VTSTSPLRLAVRLRRRPLRVLETAVVGLGLVTGLAFPPVVAATRTAPWSAVSTSLNALVATIALGVRERSRLEDELRHQATHEALTGLARRGHLVELLGAALVASGAPRPAVLFVDLDGFKAVNDTCGHHAGDAVLRAVAERLRDVLAPDDVPSRFGGDEFVVLVPRGDLDRARTAVAGIWSRPVHVGGRSLPVAGSCGGALAAPGEVSAEALLQRADAAMHAQKQARRAGAQAPVDAR